MGQVQTITKKEPPMKTFNGTDTRETGNGWTQKDTEGEMMSRDAPSPPPQIQE
jgi:hypothetical protein